MDQEFEIPLTFNNQEYLFPAQLRVQGYTYRIETLVNDVMLYFERDDSGDFRALLPAETPPDAKLPDTALVQAITVALTELLG